MQSLLHAELTRYVQLKIINRYAHVRRHYLEIQKLCVAEKFHLARLTRTVLMDLTAMEEHVNHLVGGKK